MNYSQKFSMNKTQLFLNRLSLGKSSGKDRQAPMIQKQGSAIDEKTLIRSARQGDLQAFNRLVLVYQDGAYTQACYLLGDPMAAEDAVQEAFIAMFQALPMYHGGSFQGWLSRIVTNKCLDELRRRKNHSTTSFEATSGWSEEIESSSGSADPGETPEERLLRAEIESHLLLCLDRLNSEQRTVLVLVDVLDMSYGEAAKVMGCPLGTIKSCLAHARLQMQHFLREDLEP